MLTSDQLFAFNHDQIEKICYMGYVTDKQKEISKILVGGIEERNKRMAEQKAQNPVVTPTIDVNPTNE
jgi:hypothetical protein